MATLVRISFALVNMLLTTHEVINDRVDGAVNVDEETRRPEQTYASCRILL